MTQRSVTPIAHESLGEQVYRTVRDLIVSQVFPPGSKLNVEQLGRDLGVSRTPVWYAMRRLESEGFVRINPHRDVVVSSLSSEEFRERFLLMAALEALCLREADGKVAPATLQQLRTAQADIVAARRSGDTGRAVAADGRFHRMLWEVSGLRQVVQADRSAGVGPKLVDRFPVGDRD